MAEGQKLSSEELANLRAKLKNEAASIAKSERGPESPDPGDAGKRSNKLIKVDVDSDKMKAVLWIADPGDNEQYTVPEIMAALRSNRVVLGIKTGLIMDVIRDGKFEEEVVVAEGKEVVPGIEGYYEWLIDMEKKSSPDIREDGTVDYASMNKLANVEEGMVIARYHPCSQGERGFDVCGAEKLPRIVKDLPRLRGKNVVFDEENNEYKATVAGKISRNEYNIEILTVHEVNDDIDNTYGTIDFYGDIIINGNVDSGATIRAGRNVTINGVISGGRIFAGGDVVLKNGAQSESKISARGDIYADFIEFADINAVGEIHANYILNSDVRSNKRVFVEGKKGTVLGGYTHGLSGVEVRDSGNYTEPKTDLHSGFSDEDYEKTNMLLKKEQELNEELKDIIAELSDRLVEARDKGATPENKEKIHSLNARKDEAHTSLDRIAEEKKELALRMEAGANAYVEIRGRAFRNTRIGIDSSKLLLEKEETFVRFINKNGMIERKTAYADKKE